LCLIVVLKWIVYGIISYRLIIMLLVSFHSFTQLVLFIVIINTNNWNAYYVYLIEWWIPHVCIFHLNSEHEANQTKIIIVNWFENELLRMINTTKISPQNLELLCCIHQQCNFLLSNTHTKRSQLSTEPENHCVWNLDIHYVNKEKTSQMR
jgi:hypothetical protein